MTITTPPTRTRAPQPGRTQPATKPQPGKAQPGKTQPGKAQPGRTRPTPADTASPRARSAASQRAYARKAQRQAVLTGRAAVARRAPFVLVVMGLLAVGLITSLWLSTAASADSYRLEQARLQARELSERSEQLRQEVANLQTAPELARRARDLGMVPSGEPARLVAQPDGTVLVVGKPTPAVDPVAEAAAAAAAAAAAQAQAAADAAAAAGGAPVDPATGLPIDPATGLPVDPAAGAATDPAAGAAQPPAQNPPPAGGG